MGDIEIKKSPPRHTLVKICELDTVVTWSGAKSGKIQLQQKDIGEFECSISTDQAHPRHRRIHLISGAVSIKFLPRHSKFIDDYISDLRGSMKLTWSSATGDGEPRHITLGGQKSLRFDGIPSDLTSCKFVLTITIHEQVNDSTTEEDIEEPDMNCGRTLLQEISALKLSEDADAWLQGSDGPSKRVPCLRFVLGVRSPTFAAMFRTEEAEEAKSGVVVIKDYDSVTLNAFWNFLLKDDTTGWTEDNGQMAINMLALGDRYLIKRLKNVATHILSGIITDLNALAILSVGDFFHVEILEELALCHIGTSRNFKGSEIEELPKKLRVKVMDRLLRGGE